MPPLTDITYIKALLARHGFAFSKKLGQNFLVDPTVCPRMAAACGADKNFGVLEIGPGVGVLTRELAKVAGKVAAVELDARLLPVLAETLADDENVSVIHGDVLKLDLSALLQEQFGDRPVAVCANLPYYITSPVIMRLLEGRLPVESITVTVQKEAAERLCAKPGTRAAGAVSYAVAYYAEAARLFPVPRTSFYPAPKVDSAVIRLTVRKAPPVEVRDEKALFKLIKAGFGQRRKTFVNAAAAGGFDKIEIGGALRGLSIPETARAEELTLEQFAAIADGIGQ